MARGLRNTMEGNANAGIDVGDNSTYRSEGDTVTSLPSGRVSVDVYRASLADVRGVTATGNVDVNQQSQFQVRNVAGFVGSTITGNINVGPLSFLRLRTGVAHAGSKNCRSGRRVLHQSRQLLRLPDRSVSYFFTFIRSIHGLKPARRSARNLRVFSSVSLPCASNLVGAAPMNTSGRGSTWAQSWPRMRRRSY